MLLSKKNNTINFHFMSIGVQKEEKEEMEHRFVAVNSFYLFTKLPKKGHPLSIRRKIYLKCRKKVYAKFLGRTILIEGRAIYFSRNDGSK